MYKCQPSSKDPSSALKLGPSCQTSALARLWPKPIKSHRSEMALIAKLCVPQALFLSPSDGLQFTHMTDTPILNGVELKSIPTN